ncbi:TonB-dependent receptor [Zunongwangia endophytica]|uniref:TonB-dependent receptor domain-containing protein n=1 Tax=Zunongwangia endophytica TaxID=1808945 RepID=A0ABV8HC67_9FLAO|nr:TonB-dependent receptor [Zunongwangia endophytica]MDN3593532.1 TonB-dependent receptor [Zunongwangia endophytica]
MSQKHLLLFFSLFICSLGFSQNSGTLKGRVVNSASQPIFNVNVSLEGTSRGTETNNNGFYELRNVDQGTYTIKFSYVGYKSSEINVTVEGGVITEVAPVVLIGSEEQLGEVLLNADNKVNEFTKTSSAYVSKLPLSRMENSQVYNSISSELLQSQVVTNFDDALKNAAGITKLWESTGRGSDGAGYYSLRGFAVQPNLTNGLPALTNGSPDPQNIEALEVIKGPSGTLYGSSVISYGGLINVVTKKPYNHFGGNVSYTSGSYGLNRLTADVNLPLSEGVNLRVNSAYHSQESFQDAGFRKSFFFAPSLSYQVNDRLSFLINTEIYQVESTNQTMLFLDRANELAVNNLDELGYDNDKSYTSDDLSIENPMYSIQAQMNYKLSDNWTSQTAFSQSSAKAKGDYSYLYEGTSAFKGDDPTNGTALEEGVVFGRQMNHQNSTTLTSDIQQNFIGDFEIGEMRNRVVAGLDYYNQEVRNSGTGYLQNGLIYIGDASVENINESVYGITDPTNYTTNYDNGILSETGVDALFADSDISPSISRQEIYSAYVSDIFNPIEALSIMASVRVDRFESESNSQTAWSPKLGVVYQPILDKVSLFANYQDGFSNVAPQIGEDLDGNSVNYEFDPEHAKQLEGGVKLNLLNNKVAATLSYYDIQVSNTVITVAPQVYTQGGELYSRGFEASITASPVKGLNIVANYSYNESELTEGSVGDDFLGRRPESAGPQNLANLWATYEFSGNVLNGFGAGFGGNYGSENMIFNRNTAGTFTLDDYTVLNASLFYQTDKFGITLKLNNLNDEEYYNGWSTINPQIGRNLAANFTYKF